MRGRHLIIALLVIIIAGIGGGLLFSRSMTPVESPSDIQTSQALDADMEAIPPETLTPTSTDSPSSDLDRRTNLNPDLTTDAAGLSKATVLIATKHGIIRFKFYPNDAPNTVKRIIELINSGFYNGLTFHRVVPGFVVQGGDPLGTGTGGSGQKLKAEFNDRKHVDGAVAMARAGDPDSADSQFYITLGAQPHLDHSYTVFGQVIEGMDAVRKIQRGDAMTSVIIE